jgi:transposase InsO family protein
MDERLRFVRAHGLGDETMSALCEVFGISRKTGYKWLARYAAEGPAGLAARSHMPHHVPHETPLALVEAIIGQRLARPTWGPRKIIGKLAALHPQVDWPAASTAGGILKRAGLVGPRRLHRRAPPRPGPLSAMEGPNQVWAADHKGWVRLGDGARCEPLTITDGFSRYLLALHASSGTRHEEARPVFERAFREHGLPAVIRSDNGPPFATAGVTGLSALSVWWAKLGIAHERIDPGRPQQNGRHERFHLTLLEAMRPPCADRAEQARRFAAFQKDYNEERPHEALGQKPPASVYSPSPRPMPARPPEPDYPPEGAVRRVRSNGEIKWRGAFVGIAAALAGEPVCIEETDHGQWTVRFYDRSLGVIDPITNRLRRSPQAHPTVEDDAN